MTAVEEHGTPIPARVEPTVAELSAEPGKPAAIRAAVTHGAARMLGAAVELGRSEARIIETHYPLLTTTWERHMECADYLGNPFLMRLRQGWGVMHVGLVALVYVPFESPLITLALAVVIPIILWSIGVIVI